MAIGRSSPGAWFLGEDIHMTLIIAYICLVGFNAPWYCYILILWIWVTKLIVKIGANANSAKNSQLVAFEVATANKLTSLESEIMALRRAIRGLQAIK
jgi:hypothetical protein